MPNLFEFADSEIHRIDAHVDGLVVRFAAARVGMHGVSTTPGTLACGLGTAGYTTGLSLVLEHVVVDGDIDACVGRLTDGQLVHQGARLSALPVPSHYTAPTGALQLQLQLHCANGAWLQVAANRLACLQAADAQFTPAFQC